jgi:hypothetical protein
MYSDFEIFKNDLKIWLWVDSIEKFSLWKCIILFKPNCVVHTILDDQ